MNSDDTETDERFDGYLFHAIGIVRSPHTKQKGTPIQPRFAEGTEGVIEIAEEYAEALRDLDGFERIWVLYVFDRASRPSLTVTPYIDTEPRGLFATRAPSRPNPVGMSCVRLLAVDGTTLRLAELDMLDGTPVLDIKPYAPRFDAYPDARAGWLDGEDVRRRASGGLADERFEGGRG